MCARHCVIGARVTLAVIAASTPVAAADLSEMFQHVTCESWSLTVCQDESCFVSFDRTPGEELQMFLDIGAKTYRIPAIGPDVKPMRVDAVAQTVAHYSLKFGIELANGRPANVNFIANRKDDGALDMSAAIRGAYPATAGRSAIIPITALQCMPVP